jgi:hypothetical protein
VGLLESREAGLPPAARPYPTEYVYVIVNKSTNSLLDFEVFKSRKAAKLYLAGTTPKEMSKTYAVRRARLTILHR